MQQLELTANEQADHDETLATLDACGFTYRKLESEVSLTILARKDVGDHEAVISYTIQRPNVRLRTKGHGRNAEGRVVHLANAAAIRNYANNLRRLHG